ncbi:hypothetical protein [Calothrix sp. 336/3]|uniref:hypothetical protein n=1 Tax=Calothrix sp. 336/3 TaxID=1337936 RepID=UPI0004E44A7F|nr:hypothetical protein [Calothrix sp. 336/3]AKG22345.1 hypothetical protein IJ00_14695 [Calothrix sp. 336/3]
MLQKIFNTKALGTISTTAALSTSLLIAPTPVRADYRDFINDVGEQLIRAGMASGLRGYELTHEPVINSMNHGYSSYVTVTLRAGVSYGIVGVCDRDCRDLDIALINDRGYAIASDMGNDDIPFIPITPSRTATYRIRVDMSRCHNQPCYYGVGIFGR